uniref:DEP domain-containing protein 7 n=1 Tax=Cyclopterus lumpus TaxID=8103 RepID=A0A8C2ZIF3_CYCLU
MATIKERAAALNLAEKLCVPHGATVRPFRSSSMWSGLISHLRSSVTVKRRRVHLKSHGDCFLGSEAVDVVAEHISCIKAFEGANVSRDKVVCVCQALLDCTVFEAVGTRVFGKVKKQDVFQDSKSALYRSGANQLDTPATAGPSLEPLADRLSPSRVQTDAVLPQSCKTLIYYTIYYCVLLHSPVVDEVWQEQTLLRLLNLVELPLLEGVLQCSQAPSPPPLSNLLAHSNPDLIYSSNHLDRQILKAFRDSQEDEWLGAALDCLDFLPDQPVVELSRELPHCFTQDQDSCEHALCKLLLYGTLVKHYSHTDRPPLLPQHMADVYTTVTDLLVNAKLATALEALQLCLKLLPPGRRDELRTLLTFMGLAAEPQGMKLDKEMENRQAVKRSFSRAVLHSRVLSKEKADLMVVFMLSNVKDIFMIPGTLHKGVSDKLASLAQGKQPDVTGKQIFCQPVSCGTSAESTKKTTNQELCALLGSIHHDTEISAKERKRLFRMFNQAHPEIFNQYFGESALSVL